MFVRIGLVITGLVLIGLLFLGVGAGLGYVRIGLDGIAFGKLDDSADASSESKVVSVDELLRRKGVSLDQPASQTVVEAPKPAPIIASPAIAQAPPVVSDPAKSATADKPTPTIISEKPVDPPSRGDVRTKVIAPDPRDDGRKVREKGRDEVARAAENGDGVKRKVRTPDADAARDNSKPAGPAWIIRVAAGYDKPITDPAGNEWEAGGGFEGGQVSSHGEINIENSKFPVLYRMERWNMVSWKRKLPTGHYIVLLHFAETSQNVTGPDQRVFTVEAQGEPPTKIDVFKETGGLRRELIKAIPVSVPDNKIVLRFHDTGKHHPMINGIEVIPLLLDKSARGLSKEEMRRRAYGFRVAAGSAIPINEASGALWLPDLGFDGGQTVDRGNTHVDNASFPDLYRSEHYGMSAWHTDVPNGDYTVNLHFAETWDGITAPNQRVFHVTVQDTDLHDLDIFKESGGLRHALVKTFHVSVTNGKLTIQFQNTDKNVAEINGIEVIREK
jgi:hypothetical protein